MIDRNQLNRTCFHPAAGFLLGGVLLLSGCASIPQQQSYVIAQRYLSEHEEDRQAQTPQTILQIKEKSTGFEKALISHRLAALQKEKRSGAGRISDIEILIEKCETDLVLDPSPEELAVQLQSMLPQDTNALRSRIMAWAVENAPLTVANWHTTPEVEAFRASLERERANASASFESGLSKSRALSEAGQYVQAVEILVSVAPYEPESDELKQTFAGILERFRQDMQTQAAKRQYWTIYAACARQLDLAARLSATASDRSYGEALHDNATDTLASHFRGLTGYLLDLADKHSSLWQQHGFALAICDKIDVLAGYAEQIGPSVLKEAAEEARAEAERARHAYRDKASERLQRRVRVDPIRAPFHKAEGELLTLRIGKAVQDALQTPSPAFWGVQLDPARDGDSAFDDYRIADGTLETMQANEPELIEDELVSYETVSEPETVYEVSRQRVITHHVRRSQYEQTAKLSGWVVLKHAGRSEEAPLQFSREHVFTVEEEDPATRETVFLDLSKQEARRTQTYEPTAEKAVDPQVLLEQLRDDVVALVVDRLLALVARYPEELRQIAANMELEKRWDLAADHHSLLAEYESTLVKRLDARKAKTMNQDIRQARQRALDAVTQWLETKTGR